VEEDEFWTSPTPMVALRFGSVPSLQEEVLVAGYPAGALSRLLTALLPSCVRRRSWQQVSC